MRVAFISVENEGLLGLSRFGTTWARCFSPYLEWTTRVFKRQFKEEEPVHA